VIADREWRAARVRELADEGWDRYQIANAGIASLGAIDRILGGFEKPAPDVQRVTVVPPLRAWEVAARERGRERAGRLSRERAAHRKETGG
jgi:hypothetical protein